MNSQRFGIGSISVVVGRACVMTEPTEIEKLTNTIHVLEQELAEQRALAFKLSGQLQIYHEGHHRLLGTMESRCHQRKLDYWQGKFARQRRAINHIQRRDWYPPACVIHEEDQWAPYEEVS